MLHNFHKLGVSFKWDQISAIEEYSQLVVRKQLIYGMAGRVVIHLEMNNLMTNAQRIIIAKIESFERCIQTTLRSGNSVSVANVRVWRWIKKFKSAFIAVLLDEAAVTWRKL